MNGKKKGSRWGRPLLSMLRICPAGYAVGTPRVSKPAHGVLLVPPRSLPPSATAPKNAPGEKVEKRPSSLHLILIIRCSVPLTGYPQEAEVAKPANTRKDKNNKNEQLFVATERNAKLRYEGYKKLSEM